MDGNQIAGDVIVTARSSSSSTFSTTLFGKRARQGPHFVECRRAVPEGGAVAMIASAEKGTSGRVPAKVAVRSAAGLPALKLTRRLHAHCLQIQRKT